MRLKSETHELDLVAKAFQVISREISYQGLANALLAEALSFSGAARGRSYSAAKEICLLKRTRAFPARGRISLPPSRQTPSSDCRAISPRRFSIEGKRS